MASGEGVRGSRADGCRHRLDAFQAITLSPVATVRALRPPGHNKKSRSHVTVAAAAPETLDADHRPSGEGYALRFAPVSHEIPLLEDSLCKL